MTERPATIGVREWLTPALLALVGAQVLAIVGVVAYSVVAGAEDRIADTVGSGLGDLARRVALEEDLEVKRWSIATVMLLQIPLWLGLLAGPVYAAGRDGVSRFRDALAIHTRWLEIPGGLALGVVLQLVAAGGYWLLFRVIGERDVSGPARALVDRADGIGIALLIVLTVLGAPLVEEVFYRGFLQRAVVARTSAVAGVVIASAVFAAVHFQPLQFPALFGFALVVGTLAHKRSSVGLSIWTHVGFNGFTVATLLLG